MLEAAAKSDDPMAPKNQEILNEVIEAAGLGSLGNGVVEYVDEPAPDEEDGADFIPTFTIMAVVNHREEWFDLPTHIVDSADPIAAARAYASSKPKR